MFCAVTTKCLGRRDVVVPSTVKLHWSLSLVIFCNMSEVKNDHHYMTLLIFNTRGVIFFVRKEAPFYKEIALYDTGKTSSCYKCIVFSATMTDCNTAYIGLYWMYFEVIYRYLSVVKIFQDWKVTKQHNCSGARDQNNFMLT